MGLVEAVAGKTFDKAPDFLSQGFGIAVSNRFFGKLGMFFAHGGQRLFAHSTP